jgi:hypothetical protein
LIDLAYDGERDAAVASAHWAISTPVSAATRVIAVLLITIASLLPGVADRSTVLLSPFDEQVRVA